MIHSNAIYITVKRACTEQIRGAGGAESNKTNNKKKGIQKRENREK
jgi:hypothetical protein